MPTPRMRSREIHRKAGDLGSARTFFETALQHYPEFEDALVGLGRTLIALEQPKLAVPHLQKAIALNPKSEVAYYQLAQAHRALGDTAAQEKALAVFARLRTSVRARDLVDIAAPPGSDQAEARSGLRGSRCGDDGARSRPL